MTADDQQLLVEAQLEGRYGESVEAREYFPYWAVGPDGYFASCRNMDEVLVTLRAGKEGLMYHIATEIEQQL